LAHLDELRDDDGSLVRRYFTRALYGAHPYGRTVIGTEASIGALSLDGAKKWHQRALVGAHVIFGVAGDVDANEAAEAIRREFAALPAGGAEPRARPEVARRSGMRLTLVDKPERTQSQILIGQPAPRWHDPDFLALQVATTAFGGTFTARLMDEVRSKRGLSYGASARVGQGRGAKALVAHVFPSLEQTPETLELVLRLWRDWIVDGVTAREVEFARGYLAKSFAFSVATPEDRLELRTALELAGMPRDFADTFAARVSKVEPADAVRALSRHLTPRDLEIAIVSTADELLPKLQEAKLLDDVTVEVVPYDQY
jgi:zinc protease